MDNMSMSDFTVGFSQFKKYVMVSLVAFKLVWCFEVVMLMLVFSLF